MINEEGKGERELSRRDRGGRERRGRGKEERRRRIRDKINK